MDAMITDEMVEKAARAMNAELFDPDILHVYGDLWAEKDRDKLLDKTRAALLAVAPMIRDAALEEAAEKLKNLNGSLFDEFGTGYNAAIDDAAAAIRALKGKP